MYNAQVQHADLLEDNDTYPNPYDFIPLETVGPQRLDARTLPHGLSARNGLNGTITYELQVFTPLVVQHNPQANNSSFPSYSNDALQPYIPASAIKGSLRGVHEALTNGCVRAVRAQNPLAASLNAKAILERYAGCTSPAQACPTCRLFGMADNRPGHQGDEPGDTALAGRVLFNDVPLQREWLGPTRSPIMQGVYPRPAHWAFYRKPPTGGQPDRFAEPLGRKRYYHQRSYEEVIPIYIARRHGDYKLLNALLPNARVSGGQPPAVGPIPGRATITGTIHFVNLSEEELGDLLYTVELEWRMQRLNGGQSMRWTLAHQIGYGKPYGLGTARFDITKLDVEGPQRFFAYTRMPSEQPADREARIRAAMKRWRSRAPESYSAFAALARYPQPQAFVYRTNGWFNDNSTTRLSEIQGRGESLYPQLIRFQAPVPAPQPPAPQQQQQQPQQQPPAIPEAAPPVQHPHPPAQQPPATPPQPAHPAPLAHPAEAAFQQAGPPAEPLPPPSAAPNTLTGEVLRFLPNSRIARIRVVRDSEVELYNAEVEDQTIGKGCRVDFEPTGGVLEGFAEGRTVRRAEGQL